MEVRLENEFCRCSKKDKIPRNRPRFPKNQLKGRSIFANILALQQAIKNIKNGNFPFLQVLLVDCEKAFDRVSHLAIRLIFQHLGCPAVQLQVLMTILDNSVAQVMVNGFFTDLFSISFGVRQG
jgi:hypothetical protein